MTRLDPAVFYGTQDGNATHDVNFSIRQVVTKLFSISRRLENDVEKTYIGERLFLPDFVRKIPRQP